MKTILITGFEPFAGDAVNPSWQTVKQLPDQDGQWKIIKKELPVVFERAGKELVKYIAQYRPDAVLTAGYNGAADRLNLEYIAINLDHARIADNDGQMPLQKPIDNKGDLALKSRLPVFELEKRLAEKGIPARISFSAGTFVCNHVMYLLLQECEKRQIPGGFIHIPPLCQPEDTQGSLSKKENKKENKTGSSLSEKVAVDGLLEVIRAL